MYWNCEDDSAGENDYEDVDQCNTVGDTKGSSGIRGLKESIVRELRKDFGRLLRPSYRYYFFMQRLCKLKGRGDYDIKVLFSADRQVAAALRLTPNV